jgi:copper homeostasis protein (lipoprotein)
MRHAIVVVGVALMQIACATAAAPPLRGTTWTLAAPGDARQPFIVLDATQMRLSGQAQCNRLMGAFTLEGDKLAFGQVASTRRACFPDDGSEQRFLQALSEVKRWRIEGGELLLFGEAATPLLRLQPGKAP